MFAAVVIGHSNPSGSNIFPNSEHRTRFVTVPCRMASRVLGVYLLLGSNAFFLVGFVAIL